MLSPLLCKKHVLQRMQKGEQIIFRTLRLLIRPLARFCIKHNIRLQEFEEVAKLSFLDAAEEALKLKNESVSQSRLSVMTGLHRRDVNRLYVQQSDPKFSHNLLTRVIGTWRTNERFCGQSKRPKKLDTDGRASEFAELVAVVSREANPYAVLFELDRCGLVRRTEGKVELVARGFVANSDFEQGFSLLARDTDDLIHAVEENLAENRKTPNLHLSTEFDNLSAEDFEAVRRWFLEEGAKIHQKVTNFLSKLDRDTTPQKSKVGTGRLRATFGSFSYVHHVDTPPTDKEAK